VSGNFFWNRAIFLAFACSFFCLPSKAQISPDGTTATVVNTNDGNNFDLSGGDRAGGNLFHSFGNFSVPNGGSANFLNSPDIQNIISRVTGGNISTIDGLIKANGAANLFLINPAGIVFGANSSLNIGGSFLGSTADSLLFNDGTEFSAVNAKGKPLLTINAPIGFSVRDNPNPININSRSGLTVQPGKSVTLVGGNLNFDGGKIFALQGRIELGSLGGAGKIGINENGSLTFPDGVSRGDIKLANKSQINVRGDGSGFIGVNAKNLELSGGSQLIAGIDENLGTPDTKAGDINIDTTDSVKLIGELTAYTKPIDAYKPGEERNQAQQGIIFEIDRATAINNNVGVSSEQRNFQGQSSTARGNSGDINIKTQNLEILNVASINASLYGTGNAGNININAQKISLNGGRSAISSEVKGERLDLVKEKANGNAGKININSDSVFLGNNAQLLTYIGEGATGNAGEVNINASDNITLDGNAIILAEVREAAIGNAGVINLTSGNIFLKNRSLVLAQTKSIGDAGNIFIKGRDRVSLDGGSIILASVEPGGQGNGGTIEIIGKNVELADRSLIISDTKDKGNAGNIAISATDKINLDGGSEIISGTGILGSNVEGDAGEINISASSISLKDFSTLISSTSKNTVRGDAKNINLKTDNLEISEGSVISALTENNSKAGNINIDTQNINLSSGGKIIAATDGGGQAGNININAANSFNLNGSNASNKKESIGLIFNTQVVENIISKTGLFVNNTPRSTGNSGNIRVAANNLTLDNSSTISAATNFGEGGNINLKVNKILRLDNNSSISAKASQNASGGNLTIDAKFIIASPDRNSDIVANAEKGKGGNINVTTEGIFGLQEEKSTPPNKTNDIDASSEFGLEGTVSIKNPDVNPTQAFILAPENLVTPEEVAAQVCSASGNVADANSFTITGRGGMPEDPTKPLNSVVIAGNYKNRESGVESRESGIENRNEKTGIKGEAISLDKKKKPLSSDEIIPARGMIVNEKGQVVLTRYPTPNTTERNYSNAIDCNRNT
jgi:filamentous hemagglutinin family protein